MAEQVILSALSPLGWIYLSLSVFWAILWGGFAAVSWFESELHAARRVFGITIAGVIILLTPLALPKFVQLGGLFLISACALVVIILLILPKKLPNQIQSVPQTQQDERDIPFSRARLKPDTPEYEAYYDLHPENLPIDNLTRTKPGLLSIQGSLANPLLFTSPTASFTLTEAMHSVVDGPVAEQQIHLPVEKMTEYIKALTYYYGALDVGISLLQQYHIYSHIGRGSGVYGSPIELLHTHAIAFTVEMDYAMIGANPQATGAMESARQYVEAGRIAIQLAAAIRAMGFSARAHIDGDYRVICPLVARDAGLGEIGRMGILMTPRQGPRVRLGVVTTSMELNLNPPTRKASVIDFCTNCKKCAVNCPVQAIPHTDRIEIDGALRWKIDSDICFRYWNVTGTDCGRCMTVCPYSHPDQVYHNFIRWGIEKSANFRRAAIILDDLLYGVKPAHRKPPYWTAIDTTDPHSSG